MRDHDGTDDVPDSPRRRSQRDQRRAARGIAESHPRRRTLPWVGSAPLHTAACTRCRDDRGIRWLAPARTGRTPGGEGTGSNALRRPASPTAARRPAGTSRRPRVGADGRSRRHRRGIGAGATSGTSRRSTASARSRSPPCCFYHAGQSWAIGGFLGVDAFFVLSGFLITTLLVTEWTSRGPDRPRSRSGCGGPVACCPRCSW